MAIPGVVPNVPGEVTPKASLIMSSDVPKLSALSPNGDPGSAGERGSSPNSD